MHGAPYARSRDSAAIQTAPSKKGTVQNLKPKTTFSGQCFQGLSPLHPPLPEDCSSRSPGLPTLRSPTSKPAHMLTNQQACPIFIHFFCTVRYARLLGIAAGLLVLRHAFACNHPAVGNHLNQLVCSYHKFSQQSHRLSISYLAQ